MIDKLRKRIFWIIQASLTSIIIGIILIYSVMNYKNTITSATMMMDKFIGEDIRKNEGLEEVPRLEIEGLYTFWIENDTKTIKQANSKDSEMKNYAIKVSQRKSESGIIDKYIYKVRRMKNNEIRVTLIENENVIIHIRIVFLLSIIAGIILIGIIYKVAQKISKTIVKPVEETMEKQKQFISDASHELKTPLAVIEANADVLESEVGKNKWLQYIQKETESMNKLVNDLLVLAKAEDNIAKEYKEFDLSKEVEMITSVFESMAYEKGVKLNIVIQKNINFKGDKEDIRHILGVLVDNAIKHTEKNKKVTVELEKEKNEIKLQVKNEGKPIPKEEQEKIFERFYRVDKARNRNEKRYGLGLAIAKQTVEKYKGTITVNCSEGITIFIVKIPI